MSTSTSTSTSTSKIANYARQGCFPGVYVHPVRGEVAATDGLALVVLGATDVPSAQAILAEVREIAGQPTGSVLVRVCAGAGDGHAGVTVSPDTAPDAALAERARLEHEAALEKDRADVAKAQAALEKALTEKRGIVAARTKLAQERGALRAREGAEDNVTSHALRIDGPRDVALFDLRLVRRCLRALGARSGTLTRGGDALGAGLLVTNRGIAVVMPFRA